MKVQILLFATLKDAVGSSRAELPLNGDRTTVAAVRAALRAPPRPAEGWAAGIALDASGYS